MIAHELAMIYVRDLTRLLQELRAFPDTASLWKTGPGVANAAGTLALHLEGNLREFVGRRIGGVAYTRDRPLEFSARDVPQEELIARIESVLDLIPRVLSGLSPDALAARFPEDLYGHPLSVQATLIVLNGHLNYHLGQIDYLRRLTTGDGAIALASLEPLSVGDAASGSVGV